MVECTRKAASDDRRRHTRVAAEAASTVEVVFGDRRLRARVSDVTTLGLRLAIDGAAPAPGASLTLSHPVAGDLVGTCIWRESREVGIEFRVPARQLEHALQVICLILDVREPLRMA